MLKPLPRLEGDQLRASSPQSHAALSASAGTGKTHVLTARVLRLLLSGTDPSAILCLTFTKAGAAEMADRIHARLAHWVRLEDGKLAADLAALGEDVSPASRERARTLFARVLDAAGGGLRIQTIHAFAQGLLAAFPAEADLVPGFRPLDGREERTLARQTLAELLVRAEADQRLIGDFQSLSHRLGESGAERFIMTCARAPAAMTALGPQEEVEGRLRRAFELPAGDIEQAIAEMCEDQVFVIDALDAIAKANRAWGTTTGLNCCEIIATWRAGEAAGRAAQLETLASIVLRKDGDQRAIAAGLAKVSPDYGDHAARLASCCRHLLRMRTKASLVAALAAGLRAGMSFAAAYGEAKRANGVADFDDLIRWAEELLLRPGMGDWVRYKLDQATDHILVDEAQDTNERQWNIVRALALEYFAGEGASYGPRTIFTVGDFKQAIFGFQGTNPASFEVARAWFNREAEAVGHDFLDLSMDRSFRSSPPILQLVDRLIEDLGHEALGLPRAANRHLTFHTRRPGSVTLWQPYSDDAASAEDEPGEEGWISDTVRRYAGKLARQIRHWLDQPFWLESKKRQVRPEDILILVRRRSTLASLIVARLHAENVPVAGVDRLLLAAPLAVQDLLAAARFAVQPLDDLNLAALLVSPLFGWSQDDLFECAHEREGWLWPRLRAGGVPPKTLEGLHALLAMADYATPHQFLETILSGPLDGRRKLLERLGPEARDPIEELLASALEFDTAAGPSLQHFLDWFARGDVEIVRDPSAPLDAVRVMTVHGSKGLQSPVLILADACADPERTRGTAASFRLNANGPEIPVFRPRKDELAEPLRSQIEAQDRLDREEHWRLLYVGLTRAEERLYIGGSLGPADKRGPPPSSWYMALDLSLAGLGADLREDPFWGKARILGDPAVSGQAAPRPASDPVAIPEWLRQAAPVESRPPRPLAPSSLGEDETVDPPPSPALRAAALRGKLLHQLFERLPGAPEQDRATLADRWLERSAGIADAAARHALVRDACGIIADPRFADLFGPTALAEAPIAAVIGEGIVISGTVDRLLVTSERILVADFKTGRRAPEGLTDIPAAHLRQMAAYSEALKIIFPGRRIEAALLYTAVPALYALPADLLARYTPLQMDG
ncbi:double-strand break repair helicase AddA [Sphingosinicella rhizophila]|uniref:DNA 3'-5' helicase n=1 Tax=Sphingosinicella rhizophila TaxID=3050082 RepID=A0ABU3Q2I3_9SPHN|nr:double-strand break repair helicase AddA [Sphingosinicella sp. GR2756]MDT9597599.1 double-strand break repair helicase AddA [Sphingosinicella sp. GR2756]